MARFIVEFLYHPLVQKTTKNIFVTFKASLDIKKSDTHKKIEHGNWLSGSSNHRRPMYELAKPFWR